VNSIRAYELHFRLVWISGPQYRNFEYQVIFSLAIDNYIKFIYLWYVTHSVHDITTALSLFLRSMSECVLTEKWYRNWMKANVIKIFPFNFNVKALPLDNDSFIFQKKNKISFNYFFHSTYCMIRKAIFS
jgi:hypothetical protein